MRAERGVDSRDRAWLYFDASVGTSMPPHPFTHTPVRTHEDVHRHLHRPLRSSECTHTETRSALRTMQCSGRSPGNPGCWGVGVVPPKEKQPERQGPLNFPPHEGNPARSLPIKQRALGNSTDSRVSSCVFPDVSASVCLPSVSGRDGMG